MYELLFNNIEEKRKEFEEAKPFPHIVIDDFLPLDLADRILMNFPKLESMSREYKAVNEFKSEQSDLSNLNSVFNDLKEYLSDQGFLKFLTEISGIDDVMPDIHNFGGGCHQGANGSYLDIHADFNIHPVSGLHRRLNLLIYFNKNWSEENGGLLELWDEKMETCEQKIMPQFNRCVIFKTSKVSYHGYAKVNCDEESSRKSFAAYYYTKNRPKEEISKKHTTIFKARPSESGLKRITTEFRNVLANIYNNFK